MWISPILYRTFIILYPLNFKKTFKKQAFKRTSLMFDINYPDQKVLCITNLIRSDVRGLTLERFKTF